MPAIHSTQASGRDGIGEMQPYLWTDAQAGLNPASRPLFEETWGVTTGREKTRKHNGALAVGAEAPTPQHFKERNE